MFLDLGVVVNAILLVLGLLWCREMLGRWRRDLEELRATEHGADRGAIVALWAVTLVIAVLIVNFAVGILDGLGVL